MLERSTAEFRAAPGVRKWHLRVTQFVREIDGAWRVVHRHADPLSPLDQKPRRA
jgi:hypothetical protein